MKAVNTSISGTENRLVSSRVIFSLKHLGPWPFLQISLGPVVGRLNLIRHSGYPFRLKLLPRNYARRSIRHSGLCSLFPHVLKTHDLTRVGRQGHGAEAIVLVETCQESKRQIRLVSPVSMRTPGTPVHSFEYHSRSDIGGIGPQGSSCQVRKPEVKLARRHEGHGE